MQSDQKQVEYDAQGNIKFVSKGVRQPVFYGTMTVDDSVSTDGMMVDVRQPVPALVAIPKQAQR